MTTEDARQAAPHRVVIVGAGFGGLETVYRLAGTPSRSRWSTAATIICSSRCCIRSATAALATSENRLADPLSAARRREVTTLLATVTGRRHRGALRAAGMAATPCPTTRWCSPPALAMPISGMTNGSRLRPD